MQISLITVGRLKSGPEKQMVDDYVDRFSRLGRQLGFRGLDLIDVDSGPSLEAEGERLLARLPAGARALRLDEHGKTMGSVALATALGKWRDSGISDLAFLIGGADGYSQAVRAATSQTLAFGPQTWPHRLVKVMLAEQLYRAASILAGTPYHKA